MERKGFSRAEIEAMLMESESESESAKTSLVKIIDDLARAAKEQPYEPFPLASRARFESLLHSKSSVILDAPVSQANEIVRECAESVFGPSVYVIARTSKWQFEVELQRRPDVWTFIYPPLRVGDVMRPKIAESLPRDWQIFDVHEVKGERHVKLMCSEWKDGRPVRMNLAEQAVLSELSRVEFFRLEFNFHEALKNL